MNNRYIFKIVGLIVVVALALVILVSIAILGQSHPNKSLYKFQSGIAFEFNLDEWKIVKNSNFGDTLVNNAQDISVILSSVKVEDSNSTLENIVQSRIDLLKKENIDINLERLKINNLDVFVINYKDKGDENILNKTYSKTFATLNNGYYTTINAITETEDKLNQILFITNTLKLITE